VYVDSAINDVEKLAGGIIGNPIRVFEELNALNWFVGIRVEHLQLSGLAICDIKPVGVGTEENRVRFFYPFNGVNDFSGSRIEYHDSLVVLWSCKQSVPIQIDGKMIEVPANIARELPSCFQLDRGGSLPLHHGSPQHD
jgi:hypothetical protein